MMHYEKATQKFSKLLSRSIYTIEAGLEELAAAHHISAGYGQYDRKAMSAWQNALDKWEVKWSATSLYDAIVEAYLQE